MNSSTDSHIRMVPVRCRKIISRADIEDLALAAYWRDQPARPSIGLTIADARSKMRKHALRWASRRKARAYRMPYAD